MPLTEWLLNLINGGSGSDQIYGGNGINTINGDDGNDYIDGGNDVDVLTGGAGIDTASFESLRQAVILTLNASGGGVATSGLDGDTLTGGFENVVGTGFNDTITGNTSANILMGLGGNDTLSGGDGADQLYGGDGDDVLVSGAGGSVINGISEIMDGGGGYDTADYSASTSRIILKVDIGGGYGDAEGDKLVSIEKVIGGSAGDSIYTSTGFTDALRLEGGGGNDQLTGGRGNDIIVGGADQDLLNGGIGNGNDTFLFLSHNDFANTDIIGGFKSSGTDKIDLSPIDANPNIAGDQAFIFDNHGLGGLYITNTVGPSYTEYTIHFPGYPGQIIAQVHTGGSALVAGDFVL